MNSTSAGQLPVQPLIYSHWASVFLSINCCFLSFPLQRCRESQWHHSAVHSKDVAVKTHPEKRTWMQHIFCWVNNHKFIWEHDDIITKKYIGIYGNSEFKLEQCSSYNLILSDHCVSYIYCYSLSCKLYTILNVLKWNILLLLRFSVAKRFYFWAFFLWWEQVQIFLENLKCLKIKFFECLV